MLFPWPGDCGQEKSPFAFGERPSIPTPTFDLATTIVENCPEGCILLSDRRLPIGQKIFALCSLCLCGKQEKVISVEVFRGRITRWASAIDSKNHGRSWRRSKPPWSQAQKISRLHHSVDRTGLPVFHCRLKRSHFLIPRLPDRRFHQFRKSPNKHEF